MAPRSRYDSREIEKAARVFTVKRSIDEIRIIAGGDRITPGWKTRAWDAAGQFAGFAAVRRLGKRLWACRFVYPAEGVGAWCLLEWRLDGEVVERIRLRIL